ncbi:MAG: S-methyl-5-thioribose-1-phosphate isomerase [Anaerolineales bacterium]
MRTVFWESNSLRMIDQRRLPAVLDVVTLRSWMEVVDAIRNMTVRGAPAIGAAAAFGLALSANESKAHSSKVLIADLESAAVILKATRPTAINLAWAVDRVLMALGNEITGNPSLKLDDLRLIVLNEAQRIAEEDVTTNKRMGEHGAKLIHDGDTILHHCNTGALAVVDWGTALGVIRTAHEQGKRVHVLVDETRPRLQGSRLTAWELGQYGIPYEIITDNSAGYFLRSGQVQEVLFGADRIAANGDVANKIGTYMLALAANDNNVPVYSVAPVSSIDFSIAEGNLIPIEERDPEEVLGIQFHGELVSPKGAKARNPAFDVTPNRLITAIITEKGIVKPPYKVNLKGIFVNWFSCF